MVVPLRAEIVHILIAWELSRLHSIFIYALSFHDFHAKYIVYFSSVIRFFLVTDSVPNGKLVLASMKNVSGIQSFSESSCKFT